MPTGSHRGFPARLRITRAASVAKQGRVPVRRGRFPGCRSRATHYTYSGCSGASRLTCSLSDNSISQAIYPTIIIVFVALNRSHVEKVLTYNGSMPTPHLSLAVGPVGAGGRHSGDGTSLRAPEVSVLELDSSLSNGGSSSGSNTPRALEGQAGRLKSEGTV